MNSENLIRFVRADGTESTGPVPDMMRAYAAAGFTGKLLPVTAPAPADDVVVAAPQPASPALRPGVDVDPEAARRIKAAESFLASRGFAAPPPWFAAGTEMLPEGRAKFGSLARRHEDLPSFRDAAEQVIDTIKAERRTHVVLGDARALRLLPDGTVTRGKGPMRVEPAALKGQLGDGVEGPV